MRGNLPLSGVRTSTGALARIVVLALQAQEEKDGHGNQTKAARTMHTCSTMKPSKTVIAMGRGPAAALSVALTALCACGGARTAPAAAPVETVSNDEATVDVAEHDSHHHYGGLPMLVAMSLDTLGVDASQQRAVDNIRSDLYRRMGPARSAEQALLQTLADGVAAGTIDTSKVDDALARLAAVTSGLSDAVALDLTGLHAVLRSEQRAALVDKVEAHWTLWQRANGEDPSGVGRRARFDRLAAELSLTPAQVQKVRASLDAVRDDSRPMAFEEVEARVQAFEAFRGDAFDAAPLASDGPSAHLASWGAARMAQFFETLNPVLTSDQRTKLASILHEHANHTEEQQPS